MDFSSFAQLGALFTGMLGLGAGILTWRRLTFESRDSVIAGYERIIITLRSENDRLVEHNARLFAETRASESTAATNITFIESMHQKRITELNTIYSEKIIALESHVQELSRLAAKQKDLLNRDKSS